MFVSKQCKNFVSVSCHRTIEWVSCIYILHDYVRRLLSNKHFFFFFQVPLEKLYERDGAFQRKVCSDPVPTCSQPCQRTLKCGVPGSYHECQALCHEGPCPPCPLETPVKCRCGAVDQNVKCSELTTKADEVICKKPCKKVSDILSFLVSWIQYTFNANGLQYMM